MLRRVPFLLPLLSSLILQLAVTLHGTAPAAVQEPAANEAESCAPDGALAAVPVISFAAFREAGGGRAARMAVAREIVAAFKEIGFVTLVDHNVPTTTTDSAFAQLKQFFALDEDDKAGFKYQSPESNRGWIGMGQEKLADDIPDLKESFDIGDDADKTYRNRWPEAQLPTFRDAMLNYFATYDALHLDVLRAIALGMDLDEEYFTAMCNANHQNLRLLHYPPVERGRIQPAGQKRGGIHTDCERTAVATHPLL
jgi:isopenicillin N synthase-like dioxygenase